MLVTLFLNGKPTLKCKILLLLFYAMIVFVTRFKNNIQFVSCQVQKIAIFYTSSKL